MARKTGRTKRPEGWVEQSVIVKKTHPFAKDEREAREVASRHARGTPKAVVDQPRAWRIILRRKECCTDYGAKRHGRHVTVVHCKLRPGATRRKGCR